MGQNQQSSRERPGAWDSTWTTINGLVRTVSVFWTLERKRDLADKLEGLAKELRADVDYESRAHDAAESARSDITCGICSKPVDACICASAAGGWRR